MTSMKEERSLEKALGNQIRLARKRQDLSVANLASVAGISPGMVSKIENGGISPSLSTLQAIATALNVSLSSLFSQSEERQDCSHVPSGHGVSIERRGTKAGHVYHLLGHVLRGEVAVEPYMITLRKDAVPYTGFSHSGTEYLYILRGEVSYRYGSSTYLLKEGDSFLFDSETLHGPAEMFGEEVQYLSIIVDSRS